MSFCLRRLYFPKQCKVTRFFEYPNALFAKCINGKISYDFPSIELLRCDRILQTSVHCATVINCNTRFSHSIFY